MIEPKGRPVGSTEHSWCRAVQGGTGVVVLALKITKPFQISPLQSALKNLQNSHPILRCKLQFSSSSNTFSFIGSSNPTLQIKTFDLSSCTTLQDLFNQNQNISPLQLIVEHELNQNNAWSKTNRSNPMDLILVSIYALPNMKIWVLVLRLHPSVCDRASAVSLLRELQDFIKEGEEGVVKTSRVSAEELDLAIEDLLPIRKSSKTMWSRGVDMLSYSLNSYRLTNLKFKDTKSPRCSQVVRLQLSTADTGKLLAGCKARGIKLCGMLAASGMIAAYNSSSKRRTELQKKIKYGIVTAIDSRPFLEPPLTAHNFGFYDTGILNTHTVKGGEDVWNLAVKAFTSFNSCKNDNKHFLDLADLNFLMCKAMDNPGLTSSSSLRTSLMMMFEDTVIDESSDLRQVVGVEDYIGCASMHGVGPSMTVFDTIRDGVLDCVFVYPSPLHSRKQMQEFVNHMKLIMVEAANAVI